MNMLIPTEPTITITEPSTISKSVAPKSIVLVVGTAFPRQEAEQPGFQYCYFPGIEEAWKALAALTAEQVQPALIIYRFSAGYEDAFLSWQRYFDRYPSARKIPFFLYSDQVTQPLREFVKKFNFVDEIITRACLNDKLRDKIQFVAKMKKLHSEKEAANQPRKSFLRQVDAFMKRSFDILVAGLLLLLLLVPFLVIACIIRLQSKGPVFYISPRAGKNYRVFPFYKFRTMVPGADRQLNDIKHLNQYGDNAEGPVFIKVSNDPRITKFGAFLRNTSIDELPQLINVLKGDMSLVGNRPLPLYEAMTLTTDQWSERFLAPAGITGLWQIRKRGTKDMSAAERIMLDIDYNQKYSFGYDLWIIASTPKALIQKENV